MTHQFQALNACAQHWPLRPRSSSGVPGYALPWEGGEARRQLPPPPLVPNLAGGQCSAVRQHVAGLHRLRLLWLSHRG